MNKPKEEEGAETSVSVGGGESWRKTGGENETMLDNSA